MWWCNHHCYSAQDPTVPVPRLISVRLVLLCTLTRASLQMRLVETQTNISPHCFFSLPAEHKVVVVGLDNAGKTTILYQLWVDLASFCRRDAAVRAASCLCLMANVPPFRLSAVWPRRPSSRRRPLAATWRRSPCATRTSWCGTSEGRRASEPAGSPTTATRRWGSLLTELCSLYSI